MNRNDRRVLIITIIVGVLVLSGIFFLGGESPSNHGSENEIRGKKERGVAPYAVTPLRQPESFPFDPNTADSTQLLRLGLQPWQVRNIYKYRARGGVYRKKEDFARLYGLTVKDYRRLEPYIRISEDYLPASTLVGGRGDINDRNYRDYSNDRNDRDYRDYSNYRFYRYPNQRRMSFKLANTIKRMRMPKPTYSARIMNSSEGLQRVIIS